MLTPTLKHSHTFPDHLAVHAGPVETPRHPLLSHCRHYTPCLEGRTVRVVEASICNFSDLYNSVTRDFVSNDELGRAGLYRRADDRDRFLVGRAVARALVSLADNVPASRIVFAADALGKPRAIGSRVHFNISHSGERVVVVASDSMHVGIDVEQREPAPPFEIAGDFMHAIELDGFVRQSEAVATRAYFYDVFTRKEAALKAIGTGLRVDPRTVMTGSHGDRVQGGPPELRAVRLRRILLTGEYTCHVAALP